jgi:hypothetical protein
MKKKQIPIGGRRNYSEAVLLAASKEIKIPSNEGVNMFITNGDTILVLLNGKPTKIYNLENAEINYINLGNLDSYEIDQSGEYFIKINYNTGDLYIYKNNIFLRNIKLSEKITTFKLIDENLYYDMSTYDTKNKYIFRYNISTNKVDTLVDLAHLFDNKLNNNYECLEFRLDFSITEYNRKPIVLFRHSSLAVNFSNPIPEVFNLFGDTTLPNCKVERYELEGGSAMLKCPDLSYNNYGGVALGNKLFVLSAILQSKTELIIDEYDLQEKKIMNTYRLPFNLSDKNYGTFLGVTSKYFYVFTSENQIFAYERPK